MVHSSATLPHTFKTMRQQAISREIKTLNGLEQNSNINLYGGQKSFEPRRISTFSQNNVNLSKANSMPELYIPKTPIRVHGNADNISSSIP
mgnify:CR=1 FL=1|jgi:hypothetical protein